MHEVRHLLCIATPAARVYAALATVEGLRGWLTREAELDPAVGGAGAFGFGPAATMRVVVEALEPGRRVVWRVVAARLGSWAGTRIAFELRADGAATQLAFAHTGFAVADDEFATTTTAWGIFLPSLRRYLETGEGAPFSGAAPAVSSAAG